MPNPDRPLVSIVTPSYNQGQFLEEAILSVLNQDYENIEYIIIDGGSTDNSVEIIRKYAPRLAYWVSEPDQGQTDALIKGFARARGSILGWLCSDDVLEPSMVKLSVSYLVKFPNVGLTFGDRVRMDGRGNIYSLQRFPSFRRAHLRSGLTLPQETTLFRKDAHFAAGGLDESLQMVMDYDLWCRMSAVTKFHHIPAYLGRFRVHPAHKSSNFTQQLERSGFIEDLPAEFSRVYQKHFGKRPSSRRMKYARYVQQLQAFFERRSRKYKEELADVERIRLA